MDFCVDAIGNSVVTPMGSSSAAEPRAETAEAVPDAQAAAIVARARRLMIISGLTTMIAVAAVVAAIGYRVYRAGGSGVGAPADTVITLPKGARVAATAVVGDRIIVTLDVAGATEIRTFDVKSLKETGRIRFATAP
jgi:hypothetical protein